MKGFFPAEADVGHFFDRLGFGHFVKGFDGDVGIFGAVFEEEDSTAGAEGFFNRGHHLVGVREFVVGVDEEGGVDRIRGQVDGFDLAEVGGEVFEGKAGFAVFDEGEHFGLDVEGDDFSFGELLGEAEGVVSGARSDVGEGFVFAKLQEFHGEGWSFFGLAFVALEPIEGGVAHDVGDFASEVEFSDAVDGFGAEGVGGEGSRGRLGRGCG